MDEQAWERLLNIKTAGRDDSQFDGEHHPYEPTPYAVLERLISTGYIGKRSTLIDYGSGKGRSVSFWLMKLVAVVSAWNLTSGYGNGRWIIRRRPWPVSASNLFTVMR